MFYYLAILSVIYFNFCVFSDPTQILNSIFLSQISSVFALQMRDLIYRNGLDVLRVTNMTS